MQMEIKICFIRLMMIANNCVANEQKMYEKNLATGNANKLKLVADHLNRITIIIVHLSKHFEIDVFKFSIKYE